MKMIRTTILTVCLFCVAGIASAQETTSTVKLSKVDPPKLEESTVEVEREFALPTDKLLKAFKSGEIPKDFPKFDASLNKRLNKKIGIKYLVNHQDILSEEAIAYLKEHNHI